MFVDRRRVIERRRRLSAVSAERIAALTLQARIRFEAAYHNFSFRNISLSSPSTHPSTTCRRELQLAASHRHVERNPPPGTASSSSLIHPSSHCNFSIETAADIVHGATHIIHRRITFEVTPCAPTVIVRYTIRVLSTRSANQQIESPSARYKCASSA